MKHAVRFVMLSGIATAVVMNAVPAQSPAPLLALADLDPSLGGRRVLLVDRMDGKPLPAAEGPWRLLVGGDSQPSRSARQVLRIRVATEPK